MLTICLQANSQNTGKFLLKHLTFHKAIKDRRTVPQQGGGGAGGRWAYGHRASKDLKF